MNKNELPINIGQENEQKPENTIEKRKEIIDQLHSALEGNSSVFAFFLEGADVHGTVDEYSDIDVRLVIEDENIESVIQTIEAALSNIDFKLEHTRPGYDWPKMLYHVQGTSKFLIIDITLQTYSDSTKLKAQGKTTLFDKKGILETESGSEENERKNIIAQIENIEARVSLRNMCLERELKRENYLDALKIYHDLILDKLIEALRLLYSPQWPNIGLKHASVDLPPEVVQEIEDLYKTNSIEEIQEKSKKADELMRKTLEELKTKFN
ncbi:hypothetical protein KKH39_01530 [Patescibacteria group bacterium]|nr:hypothetical protein [Patescibacteria group bacterium]